MVVLTKIYGSPILGQEEQSIESLEEHGRGLVDGAKNGLSSFRKLL